MTETACKHGWRRFWLTAALSGLCLLIGAPVAADARLRVISAWSHEPGGAPSGETPIEMGPIGLSRPGAPVGAPPLGDGRSGRVGGPWIGVYTFGDGALYGCFSVAERSFKGVWTQRSGAEPCAEPRHGERIWGNFEFRFTGAPGAPLGRIMGRWDSCGLIEGGAWGGVLGTEPAQSAARLDPLYLQRATCGPAPTS